MERTKPTDMITTLATKIKANIAQGDAANKSAEEHYAAAGRHLKELASLPRSEGETWASLVRKHVGIGERRARDLMAIADGRITVKALREKTKSAVAKHRAKPIKQTALRNAAPSARRELFIHGATEALQWVREGKVKLEAADAEIVTLAETVALEWAELAAALRQRMSAAPEPQLDTVMPDMAALH